MLLDKSTGRLDVAEWVPSPNFDAREAHDEPEVIILHSISLPPGEYGNGTVAEFFCNTLDCGAHPYYEQLTGLCVSSHFLLSREGRITQFVSTRDRAWHAGESVCNGKPKVNDFSIGIELEGYDEADDGFTDSQYQSLVKLLGALQAAYPAIRGSDIYAHSDIAPGRKTDPGPFFEWKRIFVK